MITEDVIIKHNGFLAEIDTAKVIDTWDKGCTLHHWSKDAHFTLTSKGRPGSPHFRCNLHFSQAIEVINALGLIRLDSPVFASGSTYMLPAHASDDLNKHLTMLAERQQEIEALRRHIAKLEEAIQHPTSAINFTLQHPNRLISDQV